MLVRTGAARSCFACFPLARFRFALARPFYACPLVFARLRFRPCVFLLLRLPILDSTRPDSIRLDSIHSTHSIRHDLSRFDWIRFESTKGRTASTPGPQQGQVLQADAEMHIWTTVAALLSRRLGRIF